MVLQENESLKSSTSHYISPEEAAITIRNGGVVAVPTETVYGLAADISNPAAIERIFAIKQRPANDPLIVHIYDEAQIVQLTTDWPQTATALARAFWPGPLTMILPKQAQVADTVTAGLPTVAIRMPAHPVMREICQLSQTPIAAPSANRFGCISPTTPEHVVESLGDLPDGIVNGGPCKIGLESTIIAFGKQEIFLMRPGAITAEQISAASNLPVSAYQPKHSKDVPAPGTMPRHYAPRTPIATIGTIAASRLSQQARIGHIAFGKERAASTSTYQECINLSLSGDLVEAANRLYDAMRHMDACNLDAILIDPIPNNGIGAAINDRIRRATSSGQ
jgi:L-threonylcarbamoyladenylate synthase